jgi:general secretion pathway protein E
MVSSTESEELIADLPMTQAAAQTAAAEAPYAAPPLAFSFARRHGIIVTHRPDGGAHALVRRGSKPTALAEVRRTLGRALSMELVEAATFEDLLQQIYESDDKNTRRMVEGIEEDTDLMKVAEDLPEPSDLLEADDDAPIIRLINAILTSAIKEHASDVHIEPYENRLVVRLRIDGVMQEILKSRRAVAPLVVSRIKVMSKLDIAEKRLPQDGRISLRIAGRSVDVRVSTMPSSHGERVVMRLLDKQAGRISLAGLGMDQKTQDLTARMIQRPHGIILVTGPTGSGKTTTLYAALEQINDKTRNIMTVEDPIEYYFDGIGQTQVNTKVDMTFARGLRAILRQDPDVVMVGEIRDLETAEIAVQASLTGHLVLSTLHTNTAVGAVTRLRDMGVEPLLLSSSLIGVVAQRLVRVIDPATRVPYTASDYECGLLDADPANPPTLYRPDESLGSRGYAGRLGIYEFVEIDEEMRRMIHDGAGEHELEKYARTRTPGIRDEGFDKVLAGKTTLEEVLRVTRAD